MVAAEAVYSDPDSVGGSAFRDGVIGEVSFICPARSARIVGGLAISCQSRSRCKETHQWNRFTLPIW